MESITSLSEALRTLFFEEAPRLAKEQQVIKRQRCFSASSLLLVFVLGWLQHPLAGPSQLARFAHLVGVRVSKQLSGFIVCWSTPCGSSFWPRL